MKKVYLMIYNDSMFPSRSALKDWVNKSTMIAAWRFDTPNSIYLVSKHSAIDIGIELGKKCPKTGSFLVSEISKNTEGMIPEDTWKFFLRHGASFFIGNSE